MPGVGTALPCPARPRALFSGKPQPEAQRAVERCQDRRRRLRAKRGLDSAPPRATISCGFPAQCAG